MPDLKGHVYSGAALWLQKLYCGISASARVPELQCMVRVNQANVTDHLLAEPGHLRLTTRVSNALMVPIVADT